jgi:NAD(P)-dependent dehydrogenase (short-subunit alcohol dehydrogenase family)
MLADIEKSALDAAVASLAGFGSEIRGVVCNVADATSVDAAAEATLSAFGKVHIVQQCRSRWSGHHARRLALGSGCKRDGGGQRRACLLTADARAWRGGYIINTASMAGMVNSHQGFAPCPTSKYAVVGISEGLAIQVKPLGVGVSILCPGFVCTNILKSARNRPERYGPPTRVDTTNPIYTRFAELVRTGMDPRRWRDESWPLFAMTTLRVHAP